MESLKKEVPALTMLAVGEDETIILKLRGVSFKINKLKLMKESLYFKNIFTGNYSDSHKTEFEIAYQVDLEAFKTFIDWFADDKLSNDIWGHYYNGVISKYVHRCYRELLQIFKLAVFYAVDKLLESLSYIIVQKWLQHENVIELWLMAEELNQVTLRNVVFATCLDIFENLPRDSLLSLPKENFDMLVKNVNLRCRKDYLQGILNDWNKLYDGNEEFQQGRQRRKEELNHTKKKVQARKSPRFLQCVTGFNTNANGNEEATVFSWDGNTLEALAKMLDGYKIYTQAGTQIVGRGYSIYVIGGEKFVGHGTFNNHITRYCLLMRKWFKVDRLLEERRHMVAAFIGNKLILVGGVGKYRVKLTSVHIFDVHTGIWTKGKDIPSTFTDIPPSCIVGDKLLVASSGIHCYDVTNDNWDIISVSNPGRIIRNLVYYNDKLYVFVQNHCDEPVRVKIYLIDNQEEVQKELTFLTQGEVLKGLSYNLATIDDRFVFFIIKNGWIAIEVGKLEGNSYKSLLSYCDQRHSRVCFKTNLGCFKVLNPEALYQMRDD